MASASSSVQSFPNFDLADDSESMESMDMRNDYFKTASALNSIEDVQEAIEVCKNNIMETTENTDSRRDMVDKLIRLRIRYEDLKEREESPITGFEAKGHVFVAYGESDNIPGIKEHRKIYCQQCGRSVWVYLQSSLHCTECGYASHAHCIHTSEIRRTCVANKVKTKPEFLLQICPEKPLESLKFRCVECDRKLSPDDPLLEPRLCDYTGFYYCPACHWNSMSVTPARILHNWEFDRYPVSQVAKEYLYLMNKKPVLNLSKLSPKLFAVVQELGQVRKYREDIMLMKKYLIVCRIAAEQKVLLLLKTRQHFVDGSENYSLQDLLDTKSGYLIDFLETVTNKFSSHIKSCVLCSAKGFICEICDKDRPDNTAPEIIFPFDGLCSVCPECQGVFHRQCFRAVQGCPRCARKRLRRISESNVE